MMRSFTSKHFGALFEANSHVQLEERCDNLEVSRQTGFRSRQLTTCLPLRMACTSAGKER